MIRYWLRLIATAVIAVLVAAGLVALAPSARANGLSITDFTPTSGPAGTVVTVNGTGFVGVTEVEFVHAVATVYTVVSPTQIQVTVPEGIRSGPISVSTAGSTAVSTQDFIAAPTITRFTPTSGPVGTRIVITGNNFTDATAVDFVHDLAVFTVDSPSQITATVPAGAWTGAIAVTTQGGIGVSATDFTVLPTITSVAPNTGPGAGGTTVVITGKSFSAVNAVGFGGSPAASFTIDSKTQITAVTPGHQVGVADVVLTVPGGSATVAGAFTFTQPLLKQVPINRCVTAPIKLPHSGLVRLQYGHCRTNAGQPVGVAVRGSQLYRGDLRYLRVIRKANGAVWLRTYGYHLEVRVVWSAPAVGGFDQYRKVRTYLT
ncbi:MAG: IPT/TIG domain-containing protein [Actinomycetes bacterium]